MALEAAAGSGEVDDAPTAAVREAGGVEECLWQAEKLSVDEISRRLLLEHLLWAESERGMVEPVRLFPQGTS